MNVLEQVLTVSEVARLLSITPRQVQRLCKSERLTARYADGVYLILRKSAEEYTKGSQ